MSCADSAAEMATDYYYLTVMQLHSAREAEYSRFSLVRDFCRLPKDDFFFFLNRCYAVLQCAHLLSSLLVSSSSSSPTLFLSSSVRVILYLRFAPLSSLLPLIASDHQGEGRKLRIIFFLSPEAAAL